MDTPSRGRWFAFPRILWLSLLAALGLTLPTAWLGFMSDDFIHLLILEGFPAPGTPWDLFRFAGGDPAETQRLMDEGPYPWWTLPELKIAFWRPLSSALETLDYRLFGRDALGYHLHSVAWYLAVVALFGALLRRWMPGSLAMLALLLFAMDDSHLLPVGWISNRNALVSTALALAGLWLHLEWREAGKRQALPLSLLALAVSLTAGESALGVFAYVLAYELLGDKGGVKERLRAIAPAALLGLVYLVVYKLNGYGAHGSGSYMDPVGEPGRFLVGALARVPVLWLEYDVEGPMALPKPFAFACVQPEFGQKPPGSRRASGASVDDEPLQLTWRALEAFQGGPVRPAIARTVSRCFEQLPDFAEVEHVASLACRGSDAVRMIIGMPREEVGAYLERIGWPGSRAQVEELTKTWLSYLHFAEVNLDVGESVGPTIGLALPFPEKPHEPWAKEFLQRMVDAGLCTPEKREAILQWPGRERVPLTGHRWPSNLCRTIGAKLVVRPDAPVSVKVYPYFECRFSLWSDV